MARYCLTLDLDDIEAWVALYTPDGTYEVYGRTFRGHEGLRKMVVRRARGLASRRAASYRVGRRRYGARHPQPAVR